jgi:predicted dehydrogenase
MQYREPEVTQETVEGARWGDTDEIYAEIAAYLQGKGAFSVSPEDAVELTRVLDAIRASSQHREVVQLG